MLARLLRFRSDALAYKDNARKNEEMATTIFGVARSPPTYIVTGGRRRQKYGTTCPAVCQSISIEPVDRVKTERTCIHQRQSP